MRSEILEKAKSPRGLSGQNIYPEPIVELKEEAQVLQEQALTKQLLKEKVGSSMMGVVTG